MGYANVKLVRTEFDEESGKERAILEVPVQVGDFVSYPGVALRVIGFEPGTWHRRALIECGGTEYHLEQGDEIVVHDSVMYGEPRGSEPDAAQP